MKYDSCKDLKIRFIEGVGLRIYTVIFIAPIEAKKKKKTHRMMSEYKIPPCFRPSQLRNKTEYVLLYSCYKQTPLMYLVEK